MSPETPAPVAPTLSTTDTPAAPTALTASAVPGVLAATTVLAVAAASLATTAPPAAPSEADAPSAPGAGSPAPDGPRAPGPDVADTPLAAWTRVLDELAELSAGAGPDAGDSVIRRLVRWTPPTDLGPLPAELVDRALEVLTGQAHVVEHLQQAVAENRRHARAVSTVPVVGSNPPAAYLDVQA